MFYHVITYSSNLDASNLSKAGNISRQAPIDSAVPSGAFSLTLIKWNIKTEI